MKKLNIETASLDELISHLREMTHYQSSDYERLRDLLGETHLRKRLQGQLRLYGMEHPLWIKAVLRIRRRCIRQIILTGLWSLGLLSRARMLARNPEIVEREIELPNLPETFEGYRILHLSDFHFDFIPELPEIVENLLSGVTFDLCVLTGDFRGETTGPYEESLDHLARTRPALGEKVVAVLGNHDNVEIMLRLPEMGIPVLMNQCMKLERDGSSILLGGIDDPHFYRTHNFSLMKTEVEAAPVSILLSHSAESYREAAEAGFDVQLSGHTHGGQLCLPGGIPVLAHLHDCPRRMIRGAWSHRQLQGYTSRGIGSSTLDVRLCCPPEATVHVLHRNNLISRA
ncbi:MAG: metallophosphoesterase [Kiritimatiellia bacterium]